MKKSLRFIVLLLPVTIGICFTALTGCYKQTDYPNSVLATIDSIAFSASGKTAVPFVIDTTHHLFNQVTITATTNIYIPGTATLPGITLVTPTGIGTYSIPSQGSAKVVTSATGSGGSAAVSGQIEVLNYKSGRIQGDFYFTTADGTVVKSGQFTGIVALY